MEQKSFESASVRSHREVQLFRTCLGEGLFPAAAEAAEAVLRRLGLKVNRIEGAFCCGQAAFNEGLRNEALGLARLILRTARPGMPLIIPSGSCASMVKVFYNDLFAAHPDLLRQARELNPWVFEFSDYLVNGLGVTKTGAVFRKAVAYHPSCHLLRELHIDEAPRALLKEVEGLELRELPDATNCCGFGGLFSVKFPEISAAILRDKLKAVESSGAQVLVSNDGGCLMQIGGGLSRADSPVEVRHLAEILASRE